MIRSFDAEAIQQRFLETPELINTAGSMKDWVANDRNVVLEEDGDYGLFTMNYPGLYTGHYMFSRRGRDAKGVATRMLREMFDNYGAELIRGLPPVDNKAAVWMTRQLGFTDHGTVPFDATGPCHVFTLHKTELT